MLLEEEAALAGLLLGPDAFPRPGGRSGAQDCIKELARPKRRPWSRRPRSATGQRSARSPKGACVTGREPPEPSWGRGETERSDWQA